MEKEEGILKIKVHLREDNNKEEFGIPNLGNGIIKEIGTSNWSTTLPYPKQPVDSEKLSEWMNWGMLSGDYSEAIALLKTVADTDEQQRKLMLDLMMKGGQYKDIIVYIGNPVTDEDALILMKAASELNDKEISKAVKNLDGIKNSHNAQVRKMKDYL